MPSPTEITTAQLMRRIGLADSPLIVDVRTEADFAADPRVIPTSLRRDWNDVRQWAADLPAGKVVVVCHRGLKLSQGVAAWLRHAGRDAITLEGGHVAWVDDGGMLVGGVAGRVPPGAEATVWVTRARPKIDRVACPWLIRRFIDRNAVFLFVEPGQVAAVAERFGAQPFDIEGAFWSHRADGCSFDTMIGEFGLGSPALDRLALIVRAADTARLDLAPQAAGLLAMSLGLSRIYRDDLAQVDAAMSLYDAMYRWCRDAGDETHDWPGTRMMTGTGA